MCRLDWPESLGTRTPASERTRNNSFRAKLGQTTQELAAEMDRLTPAQWRGETASGGARRGGTGVIRRYETDAGHHRVALTACPARDCGVDLSGATKASAHIATHDPEDFGLSPLRDDLVDDVEPSPDAGGVEDGTQLTLNEVGV